MDLISNIDVTCAGDSTIQHYAQLAAELENQELETGGAPLNATLYAQLLAIYCLQNDLVNAKLLWKRIPQTIKATSTELANIYEVATNLLSRDHSAIYTSLRAEWTDVIKPIMVAIEEATRKRAIKLIFKAYSIISVDNFALFVGLSTEDTKALIATLNLTIDAASNMIEFAPMQTTEDAKTFTSDENLETLAGFVSYLEN